MKAAAIYITKLIWKGLKIESVLHIGKIPINPFGILKRNQQSDYRESRQIPDDVVTMNSQVLLHLDGDEMEVSLVYPDEADLSKRSSPYSPP